VVAEGVEDDEDRVAVIDAGCDLGQGYHFGRPVPPEAVTALVLGLAAVAGSPAVAAPGGHGTFGGPDPLDRGPARKETP
jgi:predicted signal transduction protein with EAL and GGDEF domain